MGLNLTQGKLSFSVKNAPLWASCVVFRVSAFVLSCSLEEAMVEAVRGLNASATERFEKIWDLNDKKIQLKCGEVQRQLEVRA